MRAVGDRQTVHPGCPRHEHIVGGVAHHQHRIRRQVQLAQQLKQHVRIRLAARLVDRARGMEQIAQAQPLDRLVQTAPALARGHPQDRPARAQIAQQARLAFEQMHFVLQRHEMRAVAVDESVHATGLQIGHQAIQGRLQRQSDDPAGFFAGRLAQPQIPAGAQQRPDDVMRGIQQRAIPVEDHGAIVFLRRGRGCRHGWRCSR